jgi:hypothetical protein
VEIRWHFFPPFYCFSKKPPVVVLPLSSVFHIFQRQTEKLYNHDYSAAISILTNSYIPQFIKYKLTVLNQNHRQNVVGGKWIAPRCVTVANINSWLTLGGSETKCITDVVQRNPQKMGIDKILLYELNDWLTFSWID